MPRRKRGDDATEEPEGKKQKKADVCIEGKTVRLEWENDGGKWTVYADKIIEQAAELYNEGESKQLEFTVGGKMQMKILFEKSVQKNKATGWERRVRLAFYDDDDKDFVVWEWQDEHKRWNPYGVVDTLCIEDNYVQDIDSTQVKFGVNTYTVDMQNHKKIIQINDKTLVERPVRRHKSNAAIPPESEADNITVESTSNAGGGDATKGSSGRGASGKGSVGRGATKGSVGAAAAGKGSTGKKGRSGGKKEAAAAEEPVEKVRKVVKKGAAPVDGECPKVDSAHVYVEGGDIFDAMLNQTNLQNNNNKYYLMQLLEDDGKKSYSVWFRWGRVGKAGQTTLVPHGPDLAGAKHTFCSKFQDKTKNVWSNRKKFVKVPGKYDTVELDYTAGGDEVDSVDTTAPKADVPDSKIDQKLQDLINMICDVKSMEEAVMEMKYDAKKAPLGKLTGSQIKAGYAALKKIETCINKKDFGQTLIQACDDLYTRIPHDFGMQRPPIIKTAKEVKLKMQLLETLADIEVAMKIIKRQTSTENPVDTHYHDLKCELTPLDHSDPTFAVIKKYLLATHANTHNQYKMDVLDVFEMDKDGEAKQFNDVGNRQLLWHGSRLTNWMGILSQGLRIAPPEAPVTGYMFGKGVYFADMSSKSANYCYATRSKNVGLLLLCEVALGKPNELLAADINADKLPKGTHSVLGKGQEAPDPGSKHVLPCGTVVPLGKQKSTGVNNPNGYTLNYNEFIVYDVKQIKMKYLLKVKFNFKGF